MPSKPAPTERRPALLSESRRGKIAERLREVGSVTVAELGHEFGISAMTARRDLSELERLGLARRTHGGAIAASFSAAALARALVLRPRLLLLDEPLGALDLKLRRQMQLVLMELCRQLGTTFLYITHDQEEALTMSDRIAVMNRGKVEQFAAPQELYRNPASSFVAGFVGSNNLLRARLTARSGDRWVVDLNGARFDVPADTLGDSTVGDEVVVALRPECLELMPPGEGGTLAGTVTQTVFVGAEARAMVKLEGGGHVVARLAPTSLERYERGSQVRVGWEPDSVHAFGVPEDER